MNEIEEIKRRIDIVDLISSYLTVKKAGANFRALCPFHNEKTPSMMISPEKQIFKCFGCNEGGDIFEFVMKMENMEFYDALQFLAQRAGVTLEKRAPTKEEEKGIKKTRLFQINGLAAQFFHKILTEHSLGKDALNYLKKRGLTDQTIKEFLIGYAPDQSPLINLLKKRGFSDQEIAAAGSPQKFYKRIMFPIRDVMGNVIAFTGRVTEKEQNPKYLNTPETIIFHKGRVLYNLEKARGEIKLQNSTVLVEGQMDVISAYQAGVKNVVASSGTALTEEHLQILYRYSPNIIFSFDSDPAGLASAKKAFEMAIINNLNVKMVSLGDFKDPGEMIEKDPELFVCAVKDAKNVLDWYFLQAFKNFKNTELTSQNKKEVARELLPIIKKIPDNIEQAHYINLLAKKLNVSEKIIFEALEKTVQKAQEGKKEAQFAKTKLTSEALLLGIIVNFPDVFKTISSILSEKDFLNDRYGLLYNQINNWYNSKEKESLTSFLRQKLSKDDFKELELTALAAENEFLNQELEDQVIIDISKKIKNDKRELVKQEFAAKIQRAEEEGNREKLKALIKEFQDAITH